jgi:hypothetical protein
VSQGLPNVIVTDIEFNTTPGVNKVYISTFGRGIWATALSALINGIQDNGKVKTFDFNVYPSINKGSFTIELEKFPGETDLSIFDVRGRLVHERKLKDPKTQLELPLSPGCYYIRVQDENTIGVRKMVIEN